jgi:hypothetical protein
MKTAHSWKSIRGIPWPYCRHCGLVRLRNVVTDLAVVNGCAG